jgi:hypothetical protein
MSNTKFSAKNLITKLVFVIAMFIVFDNNEIKVSTVAHAQEQAKASDTVAINETQKNLFGEAKRVSNDDKNTRNSILMIVGVLCLVGFAMFLAFKNDDGEKKKTFTRTPKKDF